MTREDLECRLVDFVSGMLPEADPPLAVDADTALFEEGVINSLRILDLIAFVEVVTGARIPDQAVRLANFRSVRAIADAFGNGRISASTREAEKAGEDGRVIHVFEGLRNRTGFARPVTELLRRGEMDLVFPGKAVFRGLPRRLLETFDSVARGWAADLSARDERYPDHLSLEALRQAGLPVEPAFPASVTPPAVCYHVYNSRKGARLEGTPLFLTARGRCFRDESSLEPSLGRLRTFEMREIVALGSRRDVEKFRLAMIERVRGLVSDLALEGRLETASDPFFLQQPRAGASDDLSEPRARHMMQQLLPLKYELHLTLDEQGRSSAVASFNHHLDFFGRRFGIRLPSGRIAHSGCVAFGLERWVLAFLAQHGTDERGWPKPVRDFCAWEIDHAVDA